jgi:hypothetical protein
MAVVINSETKHTYDDYVLLPEDGKIYEIIDGEHYIIPAPETYRQQILAARKSIVSPAKVSGSPDLSKVW